MAPPLPRLRVRAQFLRVAARGRKAATPGLVLQALAERPTVARPAVQPAVPSGKQPQAASATTPGARSSAHRAPGSGSPASRQLDFAIGFTTSKKVGNAVARNRARRRLRAAADDLLRGQPPEGWTIVLIGRSDTVKRPYAALLRDLRSALERTGVHLPPRPDRATRAGLLDARHPDAVHANARHADAGARDAGARDAGGRDPAGQDAVPPPEARGSANQPEAAEPEPGTARP